jgi:nucleotide-binding universal stress UspA family protein
MTVVLTPVDGSERALRAIPWAVKLAGSGGTIVLLRVIPEKPEYAESLLALVGGDGGEDGVKRIEAAWQTVTAADLDEAARVAGSGITVERVVAAGEPDEQIVAAAAQRQVDLIAMASHGRGALGRAIFGSVADRVARTATVPVLVLRTPDDAVETEATVSRIVVPLDGSEIAERALPFAADLARQLPAPVYVVRAVDPTAIMPVAPGVFGAVPAVDAEITEQLWAEAETEAKKTVTDAVGTLTALGIEAAGATLNGSPFFAISEATHPGDLLILTSHGRGGVRRWLLGSVAEKLVREAPAPVILVPAAERVERARE